VRRLDLHGFSLREPTPSMCPPQDCALLRWSQGRRGTIAAVEAPPGRPLGTFDEDTAVRIILEGTAEATGERFFRALVRKLAQATSTHGAWVTEFLPESRRLRALAFWHGDRFVSWESPIDGTPCEAVIDGRRLVHIPD